ncbi:HNH endonuclease [Patescibacteria group bacterium]
MSNNQKRTKIDQEKIQKILQKRGYPNGEAPRGYEVHHVKPIAEGGKDTPENIRVIKATKHRQIHKNRNKQGNI